MPRAFLAAAVLLAAACSPTLNWREVTVEPSGLRVTLPCKPDRVEHRAELAPGKFVVLHAIGCEAGGAQFGVLYADVGNAAEVAGTLEQWKKASLASAKATVEREQPFQPPGALGLAGSALVRAAGRRPDGPALQTQSAYFARGTSVFQVVVYAATLKPEMTEPFFTGIHFQ